MKREIYKLKSEDMIDLAVALKYYLEKCKQFYNDEPDEYFSKDLIDRLSKLLRVANNSVNVEITYINYDS